MESKLLQEFDKEIIYSEDEYEEIIYSEDEYEEIIYSEDEYDDEEDLLDAMDLKLLIYESISSSDNQSFNDLFIYFDILDIENMDSFLFYEEINKLITHSRNYNNSKAAKLIVFYWFSMNLGYQFINIELLTNKIWNDIEIEYTTNDSNSFPYVLLMCNHSMEIENLRYLSNIFINYNFNKMCIEIIESNSIEFKQFGLIRTREIYKLPSLKVLRNLYQVATLSNDESVIIFMTMLLEIFEEYSDIPNFISNFYSKLKEPLESEFPIPESEDIQDLERLQEIDLPKNEDIKGYLIESFLSMNMTINKAKEKTKEFIKKYNLLPLFSKIEALQPMIRKDYAKYIQADIKLFRLLGPVNPFVYSKELEYGGSRMFIADNFDYDYDDNTFYNWFIGYCLQCNKKIRRKWHAVRLPMDYGGWKGCFCSWYCTRQYANEQYDFDLLKNFMIDEFEKQCEKYGIQDRIPDKALIGSKEREIIEYKKSPEDFDINIKIKELYGKKDLLQKVELRFEIDITEYRNKEEEINQRLLNITKVDEFISLINDENYINYYIMCYFYNSEDNILSNQILKSILYNYDNIIIMKINELTNYTDIEDNYFPFNSLDIYELPVISFYKEYESIYTQYNDDIDELYEFLNITNN